MKFTSIYILLFSIVFSVSCKQNDSTKIKNLKASPKENVTQYAAVKQHLDHHPNFIALTTSPERLMKILPVLESLDTEHFDAILLVLPERYSRNNNEYIIPEFVAHFPKVKILRVPKDLGPITKLVPAIEYAKAIDPESIVITVDDDTGYPNGTPTALLKAIILNDIGVAGTIGQDLSYWGIDRNKGWPSLPMIDQRFAHCNASGISYCEVIEGFGAIAYRAKSIDTVLMRAYSQISKACFTSDDLVINFVNALRHVKQAVIKDRYAQHPQQFSYGFEEDALHRGGGLSDDATPENINSTKYQKCFIDLVNHLSKDT